MTKSLRYSGGLRLLVDRRGSSSAGKFSSSSDSCLSSESAHPESDVPTERRQVWQGTVAVLVCSVEVLEWGHMSAYSSSHRINTPLVDQVYGQQPCSIPSVSLDRRWLAIDCR